MPIKVLTLIVFIKLISAFTANAFDEKILLDTIEDNWNKIATMSGDFIQYNSDETISYGKFFLSKPFKSKFIYENNNETIITTETLIVLLDEEGYRIDSYPIISSPIKNLLANEIDFQNMETNIKINEKNNLYDIYISDLNQKGVAIFSFKKDGLDLEKWEIIDEFDQSTVLEFTKIKKNISISQETYKVRYKNN